MAGTDPEIAPSGTSLTDTTVVSVGDEGVASGTGADFQKPYLAKSYSEMMTRLSEASVYNKIIYKHSELKKPYLLADSYDEMEQMYQPTFKYPSGGGYDIPYDVGSDFGGDVFTDVGGGKLNFPQIPQIPSGKLNFPQIPQIPSGKVKFPQIPSGKEGGKGIMVFYCWAVGGWCPGMTRNIDFFCTQLCTSTEVVNSDYLDKLTASAGCNFVSVTADGDAPNQHVYVNIHLTGLLLWKGQMFPVGTYSKYKGPPILVEEEITIGQDSNCPKCENSKIGYTTQQMTIDENQTLTVTDPTAGMTYSWSVAGGGSIDPLTGLSVVYTAPHTNASCAQNPTITLKIETIVCDTLKIAVNVVAGHYAAYGQCCSISQGTGVFPNAQYQQKCQRSYDCGGLKYSAEQDDPCLTFCGWSFGTFSNVYCQEGGAPVTGWQHDLRTDQQKLDGCCPAALL